MLRNDITQTQMHKIGSFFLPQGTSFATSVFKGMKWHKNKLLWRCSECFLHIKRKYMVLETFRSPHHTHLSATFRNWTTHDLWFNPLTMYHPLVWHDWTFDFIVFLQKIGKFITYCHSGFELEVMNQFYLFW